MPNSSKNTSALTRAPRPESLMTDRDDGFFAKTGTLLETGSNAPFLLDERGAAWHVEAGHVDVFAVALRRGRPVSRRRHLLRVPCGGMLFGMDLPDDGYGLLAVGAMGTQLRRLDPVWMTAAAWDAEQARALGHYVEQWIGGLAAGAFHGLPPKEHEEPQPEQALMIQEGACLRAVNDLRWVRHEEGHSRLMGQDALPGIGQDDGFFPVGHDLWLVTAGVCTLETQSTEQRVADGAVAEDLARFHAVMVQSLAAVAQQAEAAERARLDKKARADEAAFSGAFSHLASVMEGHAAAGSAAAADPLLAACRLVGDAMNLEIEAPQESDAQLRRDRLSEIARASRVRYRKVALRGAWWSQDGGPLVGLVVSEDKQERRPVALLPAPGRGYALHDPATGTQAPLDEAVAATLHPFAYSFYRPFGDGALKAWDVFRFGAQECRKDFMMILLMGVAGGILGMITPIVTGVIFNTVIPEAERGLLGQIVFALLACAVAVGLFQLVRGVAVLRVESKMDASVQSAVWDRLLNLPTAFFRRYTAGDLAMRAGGISGIRQLLSGATITSLLGGVFSVFNLALLFYYDARLALWALGLTVLALLLTLAASYAQLHYQRDVADLQSRLSGRVLQFITGITKLRVAGAESKAFEIWAEGFSTQRRLQFKARRVGNTLTTFNAVFPVLSMMVIFAAMMAREDAVMATGDFIAFNAALGSFTTSMLSMTGAFVAVLTAIPIYEQARPVLESLPEIDHTKAVPASLRGEIEIQHIAFRYDPNGPLVLHDVSLHVQPGEFVALVGPSGSGKSTILRLLLGFEEAEAGSIYYDGQDLAGLDIQAVRRQMGVVLQNGRLMSGDLFTNITGSSMATMDDAWEAARMAGLDADIKEMPMGMHTVVSEGGTTLSGGQRQRLLIARAIVNRPRILFFDEATSALDNRTQAIVSESLERLQATRIVVAHRLSTIINADRICVMDKGRVVQQGTYEELLAQGGVFADLVKRQLA